MPICFCLNGRGLRLIIAHHVAVFGWIEVNWIKLLNDLAPNLVDAMTIMIANIAERSRIMAAMTTITIIMLIPKPAEEKEKVVPLDFLANCSIR